MKTIYLTGCNNGCLFCYCRFNLNKDIFSDFKKFKGLIDSCEKSEVIEFIGGEPTIHPEFRKMVEYLHNRGIKFILASNGRSLADMDCIDYLIAHGLERVHMTVHSLDEKTFEHLTQRKKSMKETLQGLSNCVKRRIPVQTNTVINSCNYEQLPEIAVGLSKENVDTIKFSFLIDFKNQKVKSHLIPNLIEVKPFLDKVIDLDIKQKIEFEKIPLCTLKMSDSNWTYRFETGVHFVKPDICSECQKKNECVGVSRCYHNVHGTEGLAPFRQLDNYIVKLNNQCNANCIFCADSREARQTTDPGYRSLVTELLHKRKTHESIIITGGEPTIYPHLIEYIKEVKWLGYRRITIATNGLMLAYKDFTKKLISLGVTDYQISFQTTLEKDYFSITGIKKAYELVVDGMRNVKNDGGRIMINLVPHQINYKHLAEIVDFLIDFGVDKIQLSFMNPIDSSAALGKSRLAVSYEQLMPFVDRAIAVAKKKSFTEVYIENIPLCVAREYVDKISDLNKPNKEYYNAHKAKPDFCKKCKDFEICDGTWDAYLTQFGHEELIIR